MTEAQRPWLSGLIPPEASGRRCSRQAAESNGRWAHAPGGSGDELGGPPGPSGRDASGADHQDGRCGADGVRTVAPVAARRHRTVGDVITSHLSTVGQSASLWTARDRLHGRWLRLQVVDGRRRPLGVLDERTIALEEPAGPSGAHRTPVLDHWSALLEPSDQTVASAMTGWSFHWCALHTR